MKRVVVTGMGVISSIGQDLPSFWESVKAGKIGIKPIDSFDTTEYKVKLAAPVEGFDPKAYMDPKTAKRMAPFCQFAVAASSQAISQSGLDLEQEDLTRIGVSIGSGIGGLGIMEKEEEKLLNKGPKRIAPMLVPTMITNMAAGNVAIAFGLKGKCINVVTDCATGTNSIGEAFRSIQVGE